MFLCIQSTANRHELLKIFNSVAAFLGSFKNVVSLCTFLFLFAGSVLAQTGNVIADAFFDPGAGANGAVNAIAVQPDGKMLVGGVFTVFDGVSRNHVARLNADGTLDATFDPGLGANDVVLKLVLQSDGRVLVVGYFTDFDGVPRNYMARLNANGSLDATFDPGSGADNTITGVALQPDGKVLVWGGFSAFDGASRNGLARLNSDGVLDAAFSPDVVSASVNAVALQSDGKILIGGAFSFVDGVERSNIARLNADGTLDASFDPGSGVNNVIMSVGLQPDGKVLIGGFFTEFNGVPRNGIARLNADGALDVTFDPGLGADGLTMAFVFQPAGKVLITGWFTEFSGISRNGIARLNADGTLDTTFDPGSGATLGVDVSAVGLQFDGKILIGGWFTNFNGVTRNHIARLDIFVSVSPSVSGGSGTISPALSQSVVAGDTVSFTLTPNPGYVLDAVAGTCVGTLSGNTFTMTVGTANCTVIASFKAIGDATVRPVPALTNFWLLIVSMGAFALAVLQRRRV